MSSASTLPFDPFDDAPESTLRREIADRVATHRRRKHGNAAEELASAKVKKAAANSPIAAAVAARYSNEVSYQEFLRAEAEAQRLQAEAEAEIARRNAEAIAQAQRDLLEDLAEWNARIAAANAANPYYVADDNTVQPAVHPALVEMPVISAEAAAHAPELTLAEAATQVIVSPAASPVTDPIMRFEESVSAATSTVPAHEIVAAAAEAEIKPDRLSAIRAELAMEPAGPLAPLPTNLIEFPRQLVAARKARPRLAEGPLLDEDSQQAVRSQLRIFEVEPDQISREPEVRSILPEWSSIRLESTTEPHERAEVLAQTAFLVRPEPAPVADRAMAMLVDGSIVTGAFLAFVMGVTWAAPEMPSGKLAAVAAAAVLFVLLIAYYMLFFTFSDATPGMRYARIGLCTFADDNPSRRAMRLRVLSTVLAACPMGLGILWALMDDDKLGWHDRISRMYQRSY